MIIRHMRATFGCLSGQELSLREGLNVICAPNESGKSTWCAFVRAMLYGIDASARPKAGQQPDKLRYAPWSGAPMEGEMELLWQGRPVTLRRRTPAKNAPMRDFSATVTGTAEPVPGLTGQDAGQTLTGVTAPVFCRSAFIGQGELSVTDTPELERRIHAIVTSGEEGVSYSEADARLREWKRARFLNRKTGAIPALDEELAQLQQQLASVSEAAHERDEAIEAARAADDRVDEAGRALQESARAGAAAAAESRYERRAAVHLAEQAFAASVEDAARSRAALEASPFGSKAPDELDPELEQAQQQLRQQRALAAQRRSVWPGIAFLALAAAWVVVGALWSNYFYSGGLGFLFLALWAFRRRRKTRQAADAAKRELKTLRERFGTDDPDELHALAEQHRLLWNDAQETAALRAEAEQVLEQARAVLTNSDRIADPESDRLREELAEAKAQADERDKDLARAIGRLSALGDPVELRSGLAALIEQREKLTAQYDAIDLAVQTLAAADAQLRERFSPALSRRAGQLMERLTGGRYGALAFDRDFSGQARLTGESTAREDFYLSAGAADLAYLCLRLAVCELALPGDDPCPLVLDDVLVNLDDERAAMAAGLIRELAETRQILFFTCRARDAALLQG